MLYRPDTGNVAVINSRYRQVGRLHLLIQNGIWNAFFFVLFRGLAEQDKVPQEVYLRRTRPVEPHGEERARFGLRVTFRSSLITAANKDKWLPLR